MDRRDFIQTSMTGTGVALTGLNAVYRAEADGQGAGTNDAVDVMQNMIGAYGPWAAGIVGDAPARLSFRNPKFKNLQSWRRLARQRAIDRLLQPDVELIRNVRVERTLVHDGLQIEQLSWQLPYGPRTEALFLKPVGTKERLPAVLGLHDHGGNKFFGHPKITRDWDEIHPVMRKHQERSYGGVPWANELAKRGYAVLVHDTFTFGSRRVRMEELSRPARRGIQPVESDTEEDVRSYNKFATDHEHLMAKSLFCAGTTWPGVFTVEDQRALDYLAGRPDVDPERLGCAGLSGGGLRTVYLAGLDERIRCACCVGMMTTWRDYLLNKCYTHTWMIYVPGLPLELDYPEVLSIRAPLPTLVLNNNDDPLFTLPEMRRADNMMSDVFAKANAKEAYKCSYYPGPHKFDRPMQREAFDWFDRWLKA